MQQSFVMLLTAVGAAQSNSGTGREAAEGPATHQELTVLKPCRQGLPSVVCNLSFRSWVFCWSVEAALPTVAAPLNLVLPPEE